MTDLTDEELDIVRPYRIEGFAGGVHKDIYAVTGSLRDAITSARNWAPDDEIEFVRAIDPVDGNARLEMWSYRRKPLQHQRNKG